MGTIKMSGIIISENNLGDYDKMLTMLTPGLGKISCVAKGARRQRSALLAGTQFLCFGEYMMYKGANTYNINSCETIEVFYKLRTDLDKLNYAVEMTKIVRDVTDENENCYKILQLFLNTLYTLSETDKNPELILSIFKLNEYNFLGGAIIIYLIAFAVLSLICKHPLSCLLHASHLKPLSFKLKYFNSSFCLQFVHSFILGVKPKKHNNFNLKILIINSGFLSVSDNVYKVFKNNCNIL